MTPGGARRAPADTRLDGVARALGAPVTRRRAVVLIGATVAAARCSAPGRQEHKPARAATPESLHEGGRTGLRIQRPRVLQQRQLRDRLPLPLASVRVAGQLRRHAWRCAPTRTGPGADARGSTARSAFPSRTAAWRAAHPTPYAGGAATPSSRNAGRSSTPASARTPMRAASDCCDQDEECVNLGLSPREGMPEEMPAKGWHHDSDQMQVRLSGRSAASSAVRRARSASTTGACTAPAANQAAGPLRLLWQLLSTRRISPQPPHGGGPQRQSILAAQATGPISTALLAMAAVNAQGVQPAARSTNSCRPRLQAQGRRRSGLAAADPGRSRSGRDGRASAGEAARRRGEGIRARDRLRHGAGSGARCAQEARPPGRPGSRCSRPPASRARRRGRCAPVPSLRSGSAHCTAVDRGGRGGGRAPRTWPRCRSACAPTASRPI